MLQIFYGMGKGKSSSLNGALLRTKGAGLRVGYFKFLKGRSSSEDEYLRTIADDFKSFQGVEGFVINMTPEEKFKTMNDFKVGMKYIYLNRNKFDVIIMDEFIDLQDPTVAMFSSKNLVDFLKILNDKEILISGHSLPQDLNDIADLITNFSSEKHYYDRGIKARKGFEF